MKNSEQKKTEIMSVNIEDRLAEQEHQGSVIPVPQLGCDLDHNSEAISWSMDQRKLLPFKVVGRIANGLWEEAFDKSQRRNKGFERRRKVDVRS